MRVGSSGSLRAGPGEVIIEKAWIEVANDVNGYVSQ